ncbi:hypothetical protein ADUPG1_014185 [Aduncisulcus paluster]|uniref:Uncharacterized protein n=1 Tax=Aduncisulcus paluster TaxID=2918883 RepID=A0ABQ5KEU7_9EUKA|nr:hypothetical protein ADUPG1_014185 [Aduncisulcus paluster]
MASDVLSEKILRDSSPTITFKPHIDRTSFTSCDFHPTGNCLLSICQGSLSFFDIITGTPLSALPSCLIDPEITCGTWISGRDSPMATNIAVNHSSNSIDLFDMRSGKISLRYSDCHSKPIRNINRGGSYSSNWYNFSTDSHDAQSSVWDVRSQSGPVSKIKVKPPSSKLASKIDGFYISSTFNCSNSTMVVGLGHSIRYYSSNIDLIDLKDPFSFGLTRRHAYGYCHSDDGLSTRRSLSQGSIFIQNEYNISDLVTKNILSVSMSPTTDSLLSITQCDTRDVIILKKSKYGSKLPSGSISSPSSSRPSSPSSSRSSSRSSSSSSSSPSDVPTSSFIPTGMAKKSPIDDDKNPNVLAYQCNVRDEDLYDIYRSISKPSADGTAFSISDAIIDGRGAFKKSDDKDCARRKRRKVPKQTWNTCFSPNERFLFSSCGSDGVVCFELGDETKPKGFRLGQFHQPPLAFNVKCHPTLNMIAVAGERLSIYTPGI